MMEEIKTNQNTERKYFVDVAKALAIIMVLIGHSIEITNIDKNVIGTVDLIVYTMHVPTFLLCSGYLFFKTFQKYPSKYIIVRDAINLLIPYILWSTILTLINILFDSVGNMRRKDLVSYISYSTNEIWYLWFLFLCIIGTCIFERIFISSKIKLIVLTVAFICTCFIHVGIAKLIVHYIIFYIGYLLAQCKIKNVYGVIIIAFYAVMMISIISMGIISLSDISNKDYKTIFLLSIKIIGGLAVFLACYLLNKRVRILEKIGQKTLYIYILHFIPLAIYRICRVDTIIGPFLFLLVSIGIIIPICVLLEKTNIINYLLFCPYNIINRDK